MLRVFLMSSYPLMFRLRQKFEARRVDDLPGEVHAQLTRLGLDKKVHILAGLIPMKTAGAARYMKNKVPGMIVPNYIIDRMKNASDPKEEGIKLCVEQIEAVKSIKGVHGVHIMAVRWEEMVPRIVETAGLLPRPTFD